MITATVWLLACASPPQSPADRTPPTAPSGDTGTPPPTDSGGPTGDTGVVPVEVCDNGLDDDLDGEEDCWDLDCAVLPICDHPPIGGVVLADDLELTLRGDAHGALGQDVALADVSGDGTPDLVAVDRVASAVVVVDGILARGDRTEAAADAVLGGEMASILAAGDFDGDGVADVAASDGLGAWMVAGPVVSSAGIAPSAAWTSTLDAVGLGGPTDLDGDGLPELWITDLRDVGYFTFASVYEAPFPAPPVPSGVLDGSAADDFDGGRPAVGDFDGDGVADIAFGATVAHDLAGGAFVWEHLPSGTEGTDAADVVIRGDPPALMAGEAVADVGDSDGDGIDDLAVGAHRYAPGGSVFVFASPLASATISSAALRIDGLAGDDVGAFLTGAGDLDGDGAPELLAVGWHQDYALTFSDFVLTLGGSGTVARDTVTAMEIVDPGIGLGSRAAGRVDVDDDGLPDLAIGSSTGDAVYLLFGSSL